MITEKQRGIRKRVICTALTAALAVSAFAGMGTMALKPANAASDNYELVDNIQDEHDFALLRLEIYRH